MARRRRSSSRRRRRSSGVVCKTIRGVGKRRVKVLASGKWRFVKGKCK